MDILIKGLEMPKSCYSEVYSSDGYCPFHFFSTRDGSQCSISPCKCLKTRRPKDCPLIPVPEHGDLIPYLAVKKAIVNYFGKDNTEWCDLMDEIDKIDVVVEGSRGSDN